MERKWIIVAFGDIIGFRKWRRRALNTPEVADPFIDRFYKEIERFSNFAGPRYLKYLGDGFMVLRELVSSEEASKIASFFLEMVAELNRNLVAIVKECEWPPPDGFRMRVVVGHVSKLRVLDPQESKRFIDEYVGYAVNLAHGLLYISPKLPMVCHQSVLEVLGSNKKKFKFVKLREKTKVPGGIDKEDMKLWSMDLDYQKKS